MEASLLMIGILPTLRTEDLALENISARNRYQALNEQVLQRRAGRPLGVQSMAFAEFCPAITIECGKPGNTSGEAHAAELIEAALHLSEFPHHPARRQDVDLYHTVGVVKVRPEATLSFDAPGADIRFPPELERVNFRDLPRGTLLAELAPDCVRGIEVWGEHDEDLTSTFLERQGDRVHIRRGVTPVARRGSATLCSACVSASCRKAFSACDTFDTEARPGRPP